MPDKKTNFCSHCGKKISSHAEICPKCGVRQKQVRTEVKSSGLAAVLSFIIPGLGQIYNGQIGKGLLFLVLGGLFGLLSFILIGIPLLFALWAYAIYDAYTTAEKINLSK
ncbi:MAG: zinc ribbon domain-containing protein [Candidatus Aenigmarchaeota archaeon]|nr:zinc ribbon domain-containing protein [Candidatus Aenigmarchaeota archaeon]MCK5333868.1 zinc ribbon domain-containing protein [Candidatus Aenigmarchaeota archaeon]